MGRRSRSKNFYNGPHNSDTMLRNRINLFCFLMKKLIEQNVIDSFNRAIDIGCNAGVYSKIISDFGFKYVLGIDIVDECIEKANDFFAFNENKKSSRI